MYYEVRVVQETGFVRVGFVATNFQLYGVGEDATSWAVYSSGDVIHRQACLAAKVLISCLN